MFRARKINIFINYLKRYFALIIWITITVSIFYKTYREFKIKPQYYYIRSMLGCWLCISRGSAPVITMCSFLVILPVCRSLHTLAYNILAKLSAKHLCGWLTKVKICHMICGLTLIIFSLVHTAAHIMNAKNFSEHYTILYPDINLAEYKGQNPAILICNWTGLTGIVMIILLLIITVTSSSKFRNSYFNAFYIIHYSFVLYLLLMLTHPLSRVLKEQVNYNDHIPGCISNKSNTNISDTKSIEYCRTKPNFQCIPTQSWIWILAAIIIYIIEIIYRKYCGYSMNAIQVCQLPNKCVHIRLKCDNNFKIKPGQYILMQCGQISNIEWHPFTVTKCPTKTEQSIDILISASGDWTKKLHKLVKNPFSFGETSSYISRLYHKPLEFNVVGPFSSSMQFVIQSNIAVCIAAGVGITSYVATLRYLLSNDSKTPKRIHLLWLTRDSKQFLWYTKLFCSLKEKYWNENEPDRFNFQLFVTKENKSDINLFKDTLIENRIQVGRPFWKDEFKMLCALYERKSTAVFVCGPPTLKREVKNRCFKLNKKGFNFKYIQEGF